MVKTEPKSTSGEDGAKRPTTAYAATTAAVDGRCNEWYVAQVITGRELDAAKGVKEINGLTAIVPMELRHERQGGRLHTRLHVFVPGYVFIGGALTTAGYYAARAVPGVIRLLGDGHPERVPEDEMRIVLALSAHGATMKPVPIEIINGRGRLAGGPLQTLNATVERIDARNGRAAINIEFLNRRTVATVTADIKPGGELSDAARDTLRTR